MAGTFLYYSYVFIEKDKCRDFIIKNRDAKWAPGALYNLGNLFLVVQQPGKADGIFEILISSFSETEYFEPAYYKYYYSAVLDGRKKKEIIRRGELYIDKFPEALKADQVQERISLLRKF